MVYIISFLCASVKMKEPKNESSTRIIVEIVWHKPPPPIWKIEVRVIKIHARFD